MDELCSEISDTFPGQEAGFLVVLFNILFVEFGSVDVGRGV